MLDGQDEPGADAGVVERGMRRLEREGLITSRPGMHPLRPDERDTWWRLTERGWLILAASGRFADDERDPLVGDKPPLARVISLMLEERPRTIADLTDAVLASGGRLPGDPDHVWPHIAAVGGRSAEDLRATVHDHVERRVGHLALDGIVTADVSDGARLRWKLTAQGHAAVGASTS